MKTSPETHVPLTTFREYPLAEMQTRAVAFHKDLLRRRSVREFTDRPVPREIIEACIGAAGTAPSGANHQPWFFACISSPEMKRQIREAAEEEERAFYDGRAGEVWLDALEPLGTDADKPHLEDAAWLIVIFAQRRGGTKAGELKKNYYIHESVGIATGLLLAACHTAGLATLVHTPAPMGFLTDICQRPKHEKPFLILAAGYPAQDAMIPKHALEKKSLGEIAAFF